MFFGHTHSRNAQTLFRKEETFEEPELELEEAMNLEESLDVSSRYLDDEWEVNASTNLIKRQIEQINKRLSEAEKETLIIEADTDNPPGTVFENHIKKSHFIYNASKASYFYITQYFIKNAKNGQFEKLNLKVNKRYHTGKF